MERLEVETEEKVQVQGERRPEPGGAGGAGSAPGEGGCRPTAPVPTRCPPARRRWSVSHPCCATARWPAPTAPSPSCSAARWVVTSGGPLGADGGRCFTWVGVCEGDTLMCCGAVSPQFRQISDFRLNITSSDY